MSLYARVFDTVGVRTDAERAHTAGLAAIRAARPLLRACPAGPAVHTMGIGFPGVLGLAAGFDKNGVGVDALAGLGFGFVEVGTVTAEPQPGNARPRLFRLPADRAVLNRMGFNNEGAERVAARLAARGRRRARSAVVGVNIGRTKAVPAEDQDAVVADYEKSTRLLAPHADYLVVNVSSPNTPGLRGLQQARRLQPLLEAVRRSADRVTPGRVPLLVKISPDLEDRDVGEVAALVGDLGLDGVVAANTTTRRDGLRTPAREVEALGAGGVSGPPLRRRCLEVLALLRSALGAGQTLVAVGGIATPEDARERLEAGATLLQAYTGFVYGGPAWPRRMGAALVRGDR